MPAVLVVDDEHDLAATCERLLVRRGWSVVTAGTLGAALGVLAGHAPPALAIIDRQLPDGDGVEAMRAALAVGTRVIVVTGYGSVATRRLALEEGADGFLAKPFSAQELLELVSRIAGDASGLPPAAEPFRPGIHC